MALSSRKGLCKCQNLDQFWSVISWVRLNTSQYDHGTESSIIGTNTERSTILDTSLLEHSMSEARCSFTIPRFRVSTVFWEYSMEGITTHHGQRTVWPWVLLLNNHHQRRLGRLSLITRKRQWLKSHQIQYRKQLIYIQQVSATFFGLHGIREQRTYQTVLRLKCWADSKVRVWRRSHEPWTAVVNKEPCDW